MVRRILSIYIPVLHGMVWRLCLREGLYPNSKSTFQLLAVRILDLLPVDRGYTGACTSPTFQRIQFGAGVRNHFHAPASSGLRLSVYGLGQVVPFFGSSFLYKVNREEKRHPYKKMF